ATHTETSTGELTLQLPIDKRGYYVLKVEALQDNKLVAEAETTFSLLEQYDLSGVSDSIFSLGTHFGGACNGMHEVLLPFIIHSGARQIRDDFYWSHVESFKGLYNFDRYQAHMKL